MTLSQQVISLIREPSPQGIGTLTNLLANGGIPSALWGVCAAVHYGGGLCPLVSVSDYSPCCSQHNPVIAFVSLFEKLRREIDTKHSGH